MQHRNFKAPDVVVPETLIIGGIEYFSYETVDFKVACLYLHRSKSSLYKLVHYRKIPFLKRGNSLKSPLEFSIKDLYKFRQNELRYIDIK